MGTGNTNFGGIRSSAYVHPRGAWTANTAYAVNDQVTEAGAVWNCTTAHTSGPTFTGTDWELVGGTASLTQTITTSQNVTAPIWATVAKVDLVGGGAGGGGGGTALTTGGVTNQSPGGGGAVGGRTVTTIVGLPSTPIAVTIGAGGTGGAGGAVNGNTGSTGNSGGKTTFGSYASAINSGGGNGGAANSGSAVGGGVPLVIALGPSTSSQNYMGGGSPGGQGNSYGMQSTYEGLCGGGAGGYASATLGGAGGGAQTEIGVQPSLGAPNLSTTANGENGATATVPGAGGGGGGGGAPGGTGGNGGDGAPGVCIIEWRSQ